MSQEEKKCSNCGCSVDDDPSGLCLHCFCESRNLECQCGCQNDAILESLESDQDD